MISRRPASGVALMSCVDFWSSAWMWVAARAATWAMSETVPCHDDLRPTFCYC